MRKKYYHAATPETMEKIIADGVVKRGFVLQDVIEEFYDLMIEKVLNYIGAE